MILQGALKKDDDDDEDDDEIGDPVVPDSRVVRIISA